MVKSQRRWAWATGVAIGLGIFAMSAPVGAEPDPGESSAQPSEGTRVLPFTDVSPDHWAYAALLNLAGVYGCISGYPDGTFRGENAVTRYEFAAGMDACLGVLTSLVQQRRQEQDQAVRDLIEAMEQSLGDLRAIDSELPETP